MTKRVENLTNRELIVEWMLAKGYKPGLSKTSKYLCFISPKGVQYFVGSHGAIRKGKSVSDSISLTPSGRLSEESLVKFRKQVSDFRELHKKSD